MPKFWEVPNSGCLTYSPPSAQQLYRASGWLNAADVHLFALSGTAAVVTHPTAGTLYRQDVRVKPIGWAMHEVEVPYGPRQTSTLGSYDLEFDTSGGSLRLRQSRETMGAWKAGGHANDSEPPDDIAWGTDGAPDHKQLIEVHGDTVEGAEIVIPALKITLNFKHPEAVITLPTIKNLARWTGRTNSTLFLTFDPGEVLFLGCRGHEGTSTETTVSYSFAMSENLLLDIGPFGIVDKKGWQLSWVDYGPDVDKKQPVQKPLWLYVERLYEELDFATAFGFGGP